MSWITDVNDREAAIVESAGAYALSNAKGMQLPQEHYEGENYCTYEVWDENPWDFGDGEGEDMNSAMEEEDYEWGEHWSNNPEEPTTLHQRFQEYSTESDTAPVFFRVWFRTYGIIDANEGYSCDYGGCNSPEHFVYYKGECIHNDFQQFKQMCNWWSAPVLKQVENAAGEMSFIKYPVEGVCEEAPSVS